MHWNTDLFISAWCALFINEQLLLINASQCIAAKFSSHITLDQESITPVNQSLPKVTGINTEGEKTVKKIRGAKNLLTFKSEKTPNEAYQITKN